MGSALPKPKLFDPKLLQNSTQKYGWTNVSKISAKSPKICQKGNQRWPKGRHKGPKGSQNHTKRFGVFDVFPPPAPRRPKGPPKDPQGTPKGPPKLPNASNLVLRGTLFPMLSVSFSDGIFSPLFRKIWCLHPHNTQQTTHNTQHATHNTQHNT